MKTTIWHNGGCSKSIATMHLLLDKGYDLHVRNYQGTPPTIDELEQVICKLGITPHELLRVSDVDPEDLDFTLSDSPEVSDQILQLLSKNPRYIQRPIVIYGNKAKIGRPPEGVLELFQDNE